MEQAKSSCPFVFIRYLQFDYGLLRNVGTGEPLC